MDVVKVLSITGSAALLLTVLELVRRGRLKERYSILWLFASSVLLLLSLSRELLEAIASWIGIYYPPSLLFLTAFTFLLLITLHFSAVISGLSEKSKTLAQEVALLRRAIDEMRQGLG